MDILAQDIEAERLNDGVIELSSIRLFKFIFHSEYLPLQQRQECLFDFGPLRPAQPRRVQNVHVCLDAILAQIQGAKSSPEPQSLHHEHTNGTVQKRMTEIHVHHSSGFKTHHPLIDECRWIQSTCKQPVAIIYEHYQFSQCVGFHFVPVHIPATEFFNIGRRSKSCNPAQGAMVSQCTKLLFGSGAGKRFSGGRPDQSREVGWTLGERTNIFIFDAMIFVWIK